MSWWSGKLLRILAVELVVEGEPPSAGKAVMMAPNHVSWLDTFAISAVRPTRFIAKSEIRDWPIAGWVAQRAGTLFIRRAKRHDTARINELVHAALAEGDCVGFFPEGTTSEGDTLLKFHSSLFEPVVANDANVHPVAIRYEHADGSLCRAMAFDDLSFMQSLSLIARQRRIVARMTFGEPIAIRYEHPDGTHCRAMSFVGDLSFQQSLGLVIRQKRSVARVRFAPAIDPTGLTRRDVAAIARAQVATLLGLPGPGTPPSTESDH